jgi:hypothetical protein
MISRRRFLQTTAAGAATLLLRGRRAGAGKQFRAKRVVIVGIGGGLRLRESLGMAEGATLPNLLGRTPVVPGYGAEPVGAPRIAPEYAASAAQLVTPAPLAAPLVTQGALVTNLRYEGVAGHLQGHATIVSGAYNNISNSADARAPAPTLFELHRRQTGAAATDAWYVSAVGGFYRALQSSAHPDFGARFAGAFFSPPGVMSEVLPIVTSGRRKLTLGRLPRFPAITSTPAESAAVRRLRGVLDEGFPAWPDEGAPRATAAENAAIEDHLGTFFADPTYRAYYPSAIGIGLDSGTGALGATPDALTVYHAERILARFRPSVLALTLIDIDAAHDDYNGYLRGQVTADALVRHLWEMIQSTEGLKDETALLVLPEHGRNLLDNDLNRDSLGRAGVDHGTGDDGDRDVWMLALGPDFRPGVIAPTTISQSGRASGRYETIDVSMTAATLLGHGEAMRAALEDLGARPGLVMHEVLR